MGHGVKTRATEDIANGQRHLTRAGGQVEDVGEIEVPAFDNDADQLSDDRLMRISVVAAVGAVEL